MKLPLLGILVGTFAATGLYDDKFASATATEVLHVGGGRPWT